MTKEELLKQEVEDYISYRPMEGTKDFVVYKVRVGENAFAYVVEHKNELSSSDWVKMYEGNEQECYRVVGYLDSTESREKQIVELEELNTNLRTEIKEKGRTIHALQVDTGKLKNKIADLESQLSLKIINCIKSHLCKQDEDYDKPIISPKFLSDTLDQMAIDGFEKEIKEK